MFRRLIPPLALLALALVFATTFLQTHAQATSGLVINEIFNSTLPNREAIELYNTTAADINLANYVIYTSDSSDPLNVLDPAIIRAGKFLAIPATSFPDGTIGGPGGLFHEGDFVALTRTGASEEVVDVVNWGQVNPNWPNFARFAPYFFQEYLFSPPPDYVEDLQRYPDGYDTNSAYDFTGLGNSLGQPSCDDPYEPDSTFTSAIPLWLDQPTQTHRICPAGDVDYLQIFLSNSYTATIQTSNIGQALDATLTLYDSTGTMITTADDNGPASGVEHLDYRAPADGLYFISVTDKKSGGGRGADWLYTLALSIEYAPPPTPLPTRTPLPFSDVAPSDFFYEPVRYLVSRNIASGYTDPSQCPAGTPCFRPFNNTTRSQLVKMVVLMNALPVPVPTTVALQRFVDVPTGDPFYPYIERAVSERIVSGYDSTADCGGPAPCFLPYKDVTRGQLAKIVVTAMRWNKITVSQPTFSDVGMGSPFYPYVEIAACHNVISGYDDGTFRPNLGATRGQIAKVLYLAATGPQTCTP